MAKTNRRLSPIYPGYREALWKTLRRTIAIALVVGTVLSVVGGMILELDEPRMRIWIGGVAAVFWISFGGHWVELLYLNVIRPRLRLGRRGLTIVRLLVWYAGGTVLLPCAATTAYLIVGGAAPTGERLLLLVLIGGIFFVVVEMIVHAILALTGHGNLYDASG